MISLDFSLAIALYAVFLLFVFFLFWVFTDKQKDKDLSLDARFIWFCSVCAHTFVNTKAETLSVCPRCGSYNKKNS